MCGIAGFTGKTADPQGALAIMQAAIAHRGPDASGAYTDPQNNVHLAHARLAIVDLSPGAGQPMWNEDKTIAVVFNGEIYNHAELRRELLAAGHIFSTDHSDTEVLLHGYEQWGADLFPRLNGMFAFALYDQKRGQIVMARDRFGKKPLYYAPTPNGLVFASSLKAVLRHPFLTARRIDQLAMARYFAYAAIPAPQTLYEGVYKLPAAHFAVYDLRTQRMDTRAYWQLEAAFAAVPSTLEVASSRLRDLLDAAVQKRLMSDVPLGIFLSGGIDSSAVLAFAAKHVPAKQLKTFSIGFTDPSYDESAHAQSVAAHFGTDHHVQMLALDDVRDQIFTVLDHLDEPMGDPSLLPTYLLAKMARKHITVALGGDGGDEMFAGYDPFRALAPARALSRLPRFARKMLATAGEHLPAGGDGNLPLAFKIRRGLRATTQPPGLWNPSWMAPLEPPVIARLMKAPIDSNAVFADSLALWQSMQGADDIQKTSAWFIRFYLQDNVLTKVDRATMQVALEARSPFLDPDLASFALSLPSNLKFHGGRGKHVLRHALKGIVPDAILNRPKKGFGIPLAAWMRDLIESQPQAFLAHAHTLGLDIAGIEGIMAEHKARRADHRQFLWCLLALNRHLETV